MPDVQIVIGKSVVRIDLPDKDKAEWTMSAISALFRRAVPDILETSLNKLDLANALIRLDRLELNLGTLSVRHFEQDFQDALQTALDKALEPILQNASKPNPNSSRTPEQQQYELLAFFLEKGFLPWWATIEQRNTSIETLLHALLTQPPEQALKKLHGLLRNPSALKRLLLQIRLPALRELAFFLMKKQAKDAQGVLADFSKLLQKYPIGPLETVERIVWTNALQQFFKKRDSSRAAKSGLEPVAIINKLAQTLEIPARLLTEHFALTLRKSVQLRLHHPQWPQLREAIDPALKKSARQRTSGTWERLALFLQQGYFLLSRDAEALDDLFRQSTERLQAGDQHFRRSLEQLVRSPEVRRRFVAQLPEALQERLLRLLLGADYQDFWPTGQVFFQILHAGSSPPEVQQHTLRSLLLEYRHAAVVPQTDPQQSWLVFLLRKTAADLSLPETALLNQVREQAQAPEAPLHWKQVWERLEPVFPVTAPDARVSDNSPQHPTVEPPETVPSPSPSKEEKGDPDVATTLPKAPEQSDLQLLLYFLEWGRMPTADPPELEDLEQILLRWIAAAPEVALSTLRALNAKTDLGSRLGQQFSVQVQRAVIQLFYPPAEAAALLEFLELLSAFSGDQKILKGIRPGLVWSEALSFLWMQAGDTVDLPAFATHLLHQIAQALNIQPEQLLAKIDDPAFQERWLPQLREKWRLPPPPLEPLSNQVPGTQAEGEELLPVELQQLRYFLEWGRLPTAEPTDPAALELQLLQWIKTAPEQAFLTLRALNAKTDLGHRLGQHFSGRVQQVVLRLFFPAQHTLIQDFTEQLLRLVGPGNRLPGISATFVQQEVLRFLLIQVGHTAPLPRLAEYMFHQIAAALQLPPEQFLEKIAGSDFALKWMSRVWESPGAAHVSDRPEAAADQLSETYPWPEEQQLLHFLEFGRLPAGVFRPVVQMDRALLNWVETQPDRSREQIFALYQKVNLTARLSQLLSAAVRWQFLPRLFPAQPPALWAALQQLVAALGHTYPSARTESLVLYETLQRLLPRPNHVVDLREFWLYLVQRFAEQLDLPAALVRDHLLGQLAGSASLPGGLGDLPATPAPDTTHSAEPLPEVQEDPELKPLSYFLEWSRLPAGSDWSVARLEQQLSSLLRNQPAQARALLLQLNRKVNLASRLEVHFSPAIAPAVIRVLLPARWAEMEPLLNDWDRAATRRYPGVFPSGQIWHLLLRQLLEYPERPVAISGLWERFSQAIAEKTTQSRALVEQNLGAELAGLNYALATRKYARLLTGQLSATEQEEFEKAIQGWLEVQANQPEPDRAGQTAAARLRYRLQFGKPAWWEEASTLPEGVEQPSLPPSKAPVEKPLAELPDYPTLLRQELEAVWQFLSRGTVPEGYDAPGPEALEQAMFRLEERQAAVFRLMIIRALGYPEAIRRLLRYFSPSLWYRLAGIYLHPHLEDILTIRNELFQVLEGKLAGGDKARLNQHFFEYTFGWVATSGQKRVDPVEFTEGFINWLANTNQIPVAQMWHYLRLVLTEAAGGLGSVSPGLKAVLEKRSNSGREPKREPAITNPPKQITLEDNALFVHNAGLVILGAYLPRYFDTLGMLEERAFRDQATAERAVQLLQYLASGQTETPEHLLVFNKILCGLPLDTPLPLGIDLREEEIEISAFLLNAVLQNWEKMKNSSVSNLQGAFLLREGRLEEEEDRWMLHVENKAFDIVLDYLPWTISMIKLPWMEKRLDVVWKKKL